MKNLELDPSLVMVLDESELEAINGGDSAYSLWYVFGKVAGLFADIMENPPKLPPATVYK